MQLQNISPRLGFALQVIGGVLTGGALTIPTAMLIAALISPTQGLADIGFALLGASVVYPFGVALGVTLVGRRVLGRGRYWHALVGAFIALMVLALLTAPLINVLLVLLQALFILLPPLFATLAYRRFSRPTDYLNPYDDDKVDLLKYHEEGWEDYS
jgi:hypothetical protein